MCSLQSATAASYAVYSSTVDVGTSYTNIDVPKFNTSLGTLTGVQVSVVQSALTGSADVTNNANTVTTVGTFDSYYNVKGVTSGLGYTQTAPIKYDVATTPDWNPITINPAETVTLVVVDGQSFNIGSQNIAAAYFSTYASVGGAGVVTFAAKSTQNISTTGGSYSVNSSSVKTRTQFAVIYTYTTAVVPEPDGVVGVSLMAFSWLLLNRRRQMRTPW